MGKANWAELLVPAFVIGASAVGCGGTEYVEPPSDYCTGDACRMDPAEAGYRGVATSGAGATSGGATSSAGATSSGAGTSLNAPTGGCPSFIPRNHTLCVSSDGSPYVCRYSSDACSGTMATCEMGSWSLAYSVLTCPIAGSGGSSGDESSAGAPSSVGGASPSDGGASPTDGGAFSGGAAGEDSASAPTIGCPTTRPVSGAACSKPDSLTSYRCDYPTECGSYEADCTGQWQLTYHGSPTADCAAGAAGAGGAPSE